MTDASLRLFAGVGLSPVVRDAIARLSGAMRSGLPGWRFVAPDAIHLTLRFFGATEPERVTPLVDGLRAVAETTPRFRLRITGWGVFPDRRRPRVMWCGIDGEVERLAELAAGCEEVARACGYAEESRPFRPHLTIARARTDRRAAPPPAGEAPSLGELPVDSMNLYRSRLESSGAVYEVLEAMSLSGPGTVVR